MRASAFASSRPVVARVSGTCTVTASDRSRSASKLTSSTPRSAACSAVMNGSLPRSVMPSPRARSAMVIPILPRPTMPRVRPRSCTPWSGPRVHSPRRMEASAAGIWRASASRSAIVCSAAAIVLPVGALTTVIPARVAASSSTLSTPTPARPITWSRVPAAISAASTATWLRTISASYSPTMDRSASADRPVRTSTSWRSRSATRPSGAIDSATRIRIDARGVSVKRAGARPPPPPASPPRLLLPLRPGGPRQSRPSPVSPSHQRSRRR